MRARRRRTRGSRFGGAVALCLGLIGCSGAGDGSPPLAKDTDGDSVPDARDCAPADPTRWQLLAYQSRDSDADGHRADATGEVCSGATLPPAYAASTVAAGDADCDDANPAAWRLMMLYADADGDGVGAGAGQISCVAQPLRQVSRSSATILWTIPAIRQRRRSQAWSSRRGS